ncbi:MAG TPA: DUF4388 domain-containing protein, partial [Kofleriaceae bacterium]|nr:DUF4388 domain-containing protein [Kofleriaceae bacterium]
MLPSTGDLALDADAGVVVVGGTDGNAVELVQRAKKALGAKSLDVPVISTARGVDRAKLEAAGADEVLTRPAYLRDVITIGRILHGIPASKRNHIVGSLAETTGVYTLVRALASLGRSAVLTLIRGLRRGEVRFYKGEVTSAEVGLIHGQAALHQLLLWTDARWDFAHEDIVRRQQIPLSPDELFADAERFLEGVRESAGHLSPATVLEQDVQRIQDLGKQIPTEVHGVLRMFDGHRVLTDVLEDSPYRVFETLRVAQKAVEAGLLRKVDSQRPKATWRAVLAIDEWLVGSETRAAVVERTADLTDSEPVGKKKAGKGKARAKRRKAATPVAGVKAEIDWGALVPRVIGAEVGPLSGVVPAQATAGEVELPTRDRAREKLEALMDTDKRQKIFPTEIGLEPKVVIDSGMGGDTDEWERIELEAKKKLAVAEASNEPETLGSPKRKKRKQDRLAAAAADKASAEKAPAEKADAENTAAEHAAPRQATTQQATTQQAATQQATTQQATTQHATTQQATPQQATPQQATTQQATTQQAASQTIAADRGPAVDEVAAAAKLVAEKAAADAKAAAERASVHANAADNAREAAARAAAEASAATTAVAAAEHAATVGKAAADARAASDRAATDAKAAAEFAAAASRAAVDSMAAAHAKAAVERSAADAAAAAEASEAAARLAADAKAAVDARLAADAKVIAEAKATAEANLVGARTEADRASMAASAADNARAAAERAAADAAAPMTDATSSNDYAVAAAAAASDARTAANRVASHAKTAAEFAAAAARAAGDSMAGAHAKAAAERAATDAAAAADASRAAERAAA